MLRSVIHYELGFCEVCNACIWVLFLVPGGPVPALSESVEKTLLHCIAFAPLSKISWLCLCGSVSGLSIQFCFIEHLSILWTVPHCSFPLNNNICLWLCWIFIALSGLSLVVTGRGYSWLQCEGFSLRWLLLLWRMGSRPRRLRYWQHLGSVVAAPWL